MLITTADSSKNMMSEKGASAMYEIIYDRDDGWIESRDNIETFNGSRSELRAHISHLERNGCYNIVVTVVRA